MANKKAQVEEEKGLWEGILQEVATAAKVPDSNLLLLGRAGIGKRTLVQALLQHAWPSAAAALAAEEAAMDENSRATAMDYAYFGVRDPGLPDSEVNSQDYVCPAACSVTILEDVKHEKLLASRLEKFDLKYCAAVICLDMKEPWFMIEDLNRWFDMLQRVLSENILKLPVNEQDFLRTRVLDAMKKVKKDLLAPKPAANGDAPAEGEKKKDDNNETKDAPGDVDVTLNYNLGIPIVVVVTRADGTSAFESQKTMGWSDSIEAYVRQGCLSFGAAIVYTMVQAKKTSNISMLYEYLMYRMYGYTFSGQPVTPSRDALFLPSGWDEQDRLDPASLERAFESVVVPPNPTAADSVKPEECEDMINFLKRMQSSLTKQGGASAAQQSASRNDGKTKMAMGRRTSTDTKSEVSAAGAAGGAPGGAPGTDNSQLANFFQNLLTRGGSQPGAPGAPAPPGGAPSPSPRGSTAPKADGAAPPAS